MESAQRVRKWFAQDGWECPAERVLVEDDGATVGARASRQQAAAGPDPSTPPSSPSNPTTQPPKLAFFLRGSPEKMGRMMGRMAPHEVHDVAQRYALEMPMSVISRRVERPLRKILAHVLAHAAYWAARAAAGGDSAIFPHEISQEIQGIRQGCRESHVSVSKSDLFLLNAGADALLTQLFSKFGGSSLPTVAALIDSAIANLKKHLSLARSPRKADRLPKRLGDLPADAYEKVGVALPDGGRSAFPTLPSHLDQIAAAVRDYEPARLPLRLAFNVPLDGAAFAARGEAVAKDSSVLAAFAACPRGLEQCLVVRVPPEGLATVSACLPGMAGCFCGLNARGLGAAFSVMPAANVDPSSLGANACLLVRQLLEASKTADDAVSFVRAAPRGGSYSYLVATEDAAACVEAGANKRFHPKSALSSKTLAGLFDHAATLTDGAAVRSTRNQTTLPSEEALDCNRRVMVWYAEKHGSRFSSNFSREGFIEDSTAAVPRHINESALQTHCPSVYYLPPPRVRGEDVVVATNAALCYETRVCQMSKWISEVLRAKDVNACQWRYDALVNSVLARPGLDLEGAKAAISSVLLRDDYTVLQPTDAIQGGVHVMSLSSGTMCSHIGQSSDQWVSLSLSNFAK
eukprot:m51a1_g11364 hypothetical protein (632) ;mRNA; f:6682-9163